MLIAAFALACLAVGVLGHPGHPSARIVGGTEVEIEDYPYQLSLMHGIIHVCGATIITDRIAITAAHCTNKYPKPDPRLWVRAGSSIIETGGDRYDVETILQHPKYNQLTQLNDICILKLAKPIVFKTGVQPIGALATTEKPAGTIATVTGWGRDAEEGKDTEHLNMLKIPLATREQCKKVYQYFGESMICGGYIEGGHDSCKGDSGGPLVVDNTLIGVVSFGKGCARPGQLGYYANVAQLRPWIDEEIAALTKA